MYIVKGQLVEGLRSLSRPLAVSEEMTAIVPHENKEQTQHNLWDYSAPLKLTRKYMLWEGHRVGSSFLLGSLRFPRGGRVPQHGTWYRFCVSDKGEEQVRR